MENIRTIKKGLSRLLLANSLARFKSLSSPSGFRCLLRLCRLPGTLESAEEAVPILGSFPNSLSWPGTLCSLDRLSRDNAPRTNPSLFWLSISSFFREVEEGRREPLLLLEVRLCRESTAARLLVDGLTETGEAARPHELLRLRRRLAASALRFSAT
jgi:hypothetical protein